MYHSTSVKHSQQNQSINCLNTDEEQIHDLMTSLLDKIDKESNPSMSNNTCILFDASSALQRHISRTSITLPPSNNSIDNEVFLPSPDDNTDFNGSLESSNDLFQPFDDYKHSIGILLDDNNNEKENLNKNFNRVPSRML